MGLVAAGAAAIGIAASTAFEAIAAVGIGLSVIGAVTHDKALSYVGMGLGLVGGIGGLATSAGLIGADAASGGSSLFGPEAAASTADTAASTSSDVVSSLAGDAGTTYEGAGFDTADTGLTAADTGTAAAGQTAAEAASGDAAAFAPPPGDGTFVGASQDVAQPAAGAATANGAATSGVPTTAATPSATPDIAALSQGMPPNPVLTAGADSTLPTPPVPPSEGGILNSATGEFGAPAASGSSGSSGVLGGIMDFVQKNPLLTYGVLQSGGSLLQGLTSTLTPAQVGALNAQAAANQAAANLTTQQTQNLAQPRSTATLAPVTGTPNNIITPPNAGIINGAPPVNVTGAPT